MEITGKIPGAGDNDRGVLHQTARLIGLSPPWQFLGAFSTARVLRHDWSLMKGMLGQAH